MKARYYIWGALGGLAVTSAPGTAWWVLPGLGLAAHMLVDERPDLVHRALPMLEDARLALPSMAWALPGVKAERRPGAAQERVSAPPDERPELLVTLDEQPHRLIIGHTRGGKTTLIHELATSWAQRGERVLVGDPDAAPGLWPGCEVRGYGDDVESIGELLNVVQAEVEGRRLARAQGVRRFEPLHLVIDEAHDVLPALDGGLELFEDVARRGGKLNIRMTVGVQDKQVKTLGLEGKSALLRNFCTADVMKNREGRRVAVLRDPETGQKTSMPIPQLTDPESLIMVRPATETTQNLRRPSVTRAPADDLLASLLAESVTPHQDAEGMPITTVTGNGSNGHSSVTVGGGGGQVNVNVTQVAPQPAAKDRTARTAFERALVELYRAAGAEGRTYGSTYEQFKGSRDMTFKAWQEGRNTRKD